MLLVNPMLYENNSIEQFINASVNCMIRDIPRLNEKKEYWLFYFIKEDFRMNLWSLYQTDIDVDFFGFPMIRKNTRHAIEAFLDLYNLCSEQEYMEILKYCAKQKSDIQKYRKYLYREQFTIISKYNIAKEMYDKDFSFLIEVSKKSNKYVHPNVFIDIIPVEQREEKLKILHELVLTNIYLLNEAYLLLIKQFNSNEHPCIGCMPYGCNRNCSWCYQCALDKFNRVVNSKLLVEMNPQTNYWNRII